jgi:hypothetical protein
MATFDQHTEMEKLVQTLARMDLPGEVPTSNEADSRSRAYDDATALYDMIQQARDILKYARSR